MTTQVQVTKIGYNFVLPLSKEIVEKLGVQDGGHVELTTDREAVVLRPSQPADNRQQEFHKLKNEMFDKYADVFTALAEGAK